MEDIYFNIVSAPQIGNYQVFKLIGEFDLNEVYLFESKVSEALSQKPPKIVLDISELEYLDSSAIGAFVRLYREVVEKSKGKLYFFNPKEFIEELFELSNLKNFLSIIHEQSELEQKCKE